MSDQRLLATKEGTDDMIAEFQRCASMAGGAIMGPEAANQLGAYLQACRSRLPSSAAVLRDSKRRKREVAA